MTPYAFEIRYAWADAYFQLLWEGNPCFRDAMLSLDAERISHWSERLGILLPALLESIEEVRYLANAAGIEPSADTKTLLEFVRAALWQHTQIPYSEKPPPAGLYGLRPPLPYEPKQHYLAWVDMLLEAEKTGEYECPAQEVYLRQQIAERLGIEYLTADDLARIVRMIAERYYDQTKQGDPREFSPMLKKGYIPRAVKQLYLRVWNGLSWQQIADRLNTNKESVRTSTETAAKILGVKLPEPED
jgi:hypothetical protein